ncbi:hypothetical protein RHAL1_00969 [Beijerinckiaceae bacterium RH AL1]|nr:class I SAM-dependent methyltransferase [Beijerinckiaceae bacterium]VVB43911.1 hypothetical protein RHCH11_RHCH11_00944 [Beijerinckiaceae bacterium RH CH11]VVB43938.1 hypothetical protein RHAL8_00941 [Beijerinckiaceae bacterium RH AL8]VVC54076.1 hypothetical protein RHAL1_00969 [Beijerinckiaceae bacterium RH AL1]
MADVTRYPRRLAALAGEFMSIAARAGSLRDARSVWTIARDAEKIPGWVEGAAAREVAARSLLLPGDPAIVEVGVFMGRSTALLAAARRARGSGKVFCVDPFDGSGDDFSVPFYQAELDKVGARSLEEAFRRNIGSRGLDPWVEVLKGPSALVAASWSRPIDLLLLDGDHSPVGARAIFETWSRFLAPGGQIILHNTGERVYAEGHDGNYRVASSDLRQPPFRDLRQIAYTSYATRG